MIDCITFEPELTYKLRHRLGICTLDNGTPSSHCHSHQHRSGQCFKFIVVTFEMFRVGISTYLLIYFSFFIIWEHANKLCEWS